MVYASDDAESADIDYKIIELKNKGFKDKDVSIILSTLYAYNKNEIYKRSLELS